MPRHQALPSSWSLVTLRTDEKGTSEKIGVLNASQLIAPPLPDSSLTPLLSGLLPNRNHNEDLLHALDRLPKRAGAGTQPVFSVFAADPFLEGKQIAQRLLEKGYQRIVNWPTSAQFGPEFAGALDSVRLGPRQEYENLLRLAGRGLSISVAVCSAEAAVEFSRLKPEIVFLAPTFESWSNGKMRGRDLLQRCAALASAMSDDIPIVLMAARGAVSLAAARKAGAAALLEA